MSHGPPFVIPLRKSYLVAIIDMFANITLRADAGPISIGADSVD